MDNPKINKQKLREASTPKHVAISLTGEPTLYKPIGELIKTFHKRGSPLFLFLTERYLQPWQS
jgi:tRNA wybutosine-synthesizing protein 1